MSAYRSDPRWLAARAEYVADDRSGESAAAALLRRVAAAMRMRELEEQIDNNPSDVK